MNKKYGQKLLDTAKHATKVGKNFLIDAIKTAPKRAIQETAEVTGDLTGNKIADKITNVSKLIQNKLDEVKCGIKILRERYISPEKRQQVIDELRLV